MMYYVLVLSSRYNRNTAKVHCTIGTSTMYYVPCTMYMMCTR